MKRALIGAAISALGTSSALAAEYLTELTSVVYKTAGTAHEISARGQTCISQHLAPGVVGGQLIIAADLNSGVIVANSALEYGNFPRWQVRSRFTLEARDGRFRIQQTDIERFYDTSNIGWGAIGKWTGSQWKKAEEAFTASATAVAECVQAASKRHDW